ncbi:hypothetical protein IE53DRAFT_329096 [Violaceomyces palustris]|uniref:Uncharacterized protein n=1 Tax=Violaceomyces palustris TaxID=1673888 RepID=A0ACD0NZ18_9BASI|nr:hypothetical protein IE53DRAFT_329096 [Violaceomyces palustris]
MGLFSSSTPEAAAPLPPSPVPIGVFPHFTQHQQQLALKIRERKVSFTGDDIAVTDAISKLKVFEVEGKVMSLSGRKVIKDSGGNDLFVLRKKHLAIHSTFQGLDPKTDKVLFTVKSSFSFGTKLTATFPNVAGDGSETELILKGDILDRKAEICTSGGVPVARIARSFLNGGEVLFDQQTYVLTVAAGVDAALLTAICICLVSTCMNTT